MYKFDFERVSEGEGSPLVKFLIVFGLVVGGFLVSIVAVGFLMATIMTTDASVITDFTSNIESYPEYRNAWNIIQGATHFIVIFLPAFVFIRFIERKKFDALQRPGIKKVALPYILSIAFLFCAMPFLSWVVEINQAIPMPDWAIEQAALQNKQLEYMTAFSGFGEILVGIVVFAILPAVGEELLFRGVIQNLLAKGFQNIHISILITSLFFGLFHMQPDKMIPLTLMGAMFGYIYYWTGNLWVPMAIHFVNNAFTIGMVYYFNQSGQSVDVETLGAENKILVLASALFAGLFLWLIHRKTFLPYKS